MTTRSTTALGLLHSLDGQNRPEAEAATGSIPCFERPAEERDSLPDAEQPMTRRRRGRALAIVDDLDLDEALAVADPDAGTRGAGMAQDVRQRLLDDPVRGQLDARREPGGLAFDADFDGET